MRTYTSYAAAVADGAETIIKDSATSWRGYMPGEIQRPVAPDPVPTISAWQMRKALNAIGLRDQIEAAVAGASRDVQDGWANAREFERNHPLIVQMVSEMGLSDAEVDAVFKLGATL